MAIFYISDTHFGHKNIIGYDQRPYFTVAEMDEDMIQRWNSVVKPRDVVYHLGDVSWYKTEAEAEILARLNGDKILIRGNHDYEICDGWYNVLPFAEIKDDNRKVILSHYPIAAYKNMEHGAFHLYGHVHNTPENDLFNDYRRVWEEKYKKTMRSCNVGCMIDYMDYTPRTLDELCEIHGWT